jgi:hypothetical protein
MGTDPNSCRPTGGVGNAMQQQTSNLFSGHIAEPIISRSFQLSLSAGTPSAYGSSRSALS